MSMFFYGNSWNESEQSHLKKKVHNAQQDSFWKSIWEGVLVSHCCFKISANTNYWSVYWFIVKKVMITEKYFCSET